MSVFDLLFAEGYKEIAAHDERGDIHWSAVSATTGAAVVARLRTGNWQKEQEIVAKLAALKPGFVPTLLATLPHAAGAVLVYNRVLGRDLADLRGSYGGVIPVSVLIRVCGLVTHAVAFCHAHRIFLGTLTLQ